SYFFFSSRRRHTRFSRDWSSDVCSSDLEFSVDRANQVLDATGWKRGADGVRARDGRRLKLLFQTSINTPRQKTQAIIKQAAAKRSEERRVGKESRTRWCADH